MKRFRVVMFPQRRLLGVKQGRKWLHINTAAPSQVLLLLLLLLPPLREKAWRSRRPLFAHVSRLQKAGAENEILALLFPRNKQKHTQSLSSCRELCHVLFSAVGERERVPKGERLFGGIRPLLPRSDGRCPMEQQGGGCDGPQRPGHDQLLPQPPDAASETREREREREWFVVEGLKAGCSL